MNLVPGLQVPVTFFRQSTIAAVCRLVVALFAVASRSDGHAMMMNPTQDDSDSCPNPNSITNNNKTVLVTGANGYLGSWIVQELLAKGYTVHACVRDATNPHKIQHLKDLIAAHDENSSTEKLKFFSTGNLGQDNGKAAFDEAMNGVDAVMHVSIAMDRSNGMDGMFGPTLVGTRHLLEAMDRHAVKTLILTSSTAAVERQADGMTNESHWLDLEQQKSLGNWYSATKIAQEQMALQEWSSLESSQQPQPQQPQQHHAVRVVSLCPTRLLGPPIAPIISIDGWMAFVRDLLRDGRSNVPNDTIEFVHVQDVAKLHIAALEQVDASGRYLCVGESWHWNHFMTKLQQLHRFMPAVQLYSGDDQVAPKQYSFEKRQSLGVTLRSMDQLLQESVEYLRARKAI